MWVSSWLPCLCFSQTGEAPLASALHARGSDQLGANLTNASATRLLICVSVQQLCFSDRDASVALPPRRATQAQLCLRGEWYESQCGHQACIMPCWTAIWRTLRRRAGCQKKQRVASLWSGFYACWAPLNNRDPSCHSSHSTPKKLWEHRNK